MRQIFMSGRDDNLENEFLQKVKGAGASGCHLPSNTNGLTANDKQQQEAKRVWASSSFYWLSTNEFPK